MLPQVSPEVLSRMKQAMVESNSSASHSFLLDDDSSLPFQAAELLANMDDKVREKKNEIGDGGWVSCCCTSIMHS